MLSETQVQARVRELGAAITQRYAGQRPLLLGVLNGAFVFAADLARACDLDCEVSFIKLSSYKGTASTGEVQTRIGLEASVEGRHIIVVEDIVDSGHTLATFLPDLERLGPASVAVATLLFKPDSLQHSLRLDFVGFEIPPRFVVGYGLDYDGLGRNLPAIYELWEG